MWKTATFNILKGCNGCIKYINLQLLIFVNVCLFLSTPLSVESSSLTTKIDDWGQAWRSSLIFTDIVLFTLRSFSQIHRVAHVSWFWRIEAFPIMDCLRSRVYVHEIKQSTHIFWFIKYILLSSENISKLSTHSHNNSPW